MIRNCTLLAFGLLLGLLTSLPVLGQAPQLAKYQKGTTEKGQKVGVWEYYGYTTTGQQVVVHLASSAWASPALRNSIMKQTSKCPSYVCGYDHNNTTCF